MREVVACDKITMKVFRRYRSISEAAEDCGSPHSVIARTCRDRGITRDSSFVFRYADDYDQNETFRRGAGWRPVALELPTGQELQFYDATEAAEAIGSTRKAVLTAVYRGTRVRGCKARWLR